MNTKLLSARIKNFKGLDDIDLNFKNLTILVGPNSSGKSNSLEALYFLKSLLHANSVPAVEQMRKILKVGTNEMSISINTSSFNNSKKSTYSINLTTDIENTLISYESLQIDDVTVINVKDGKGEVRDEDNQNIQKYQSELDSIALNSAGNFGEKPVTLELSKFIKNWELYDLDTDFMRSNLLPFSRSSRLKSKFQKSLDKKGRNIQTVLKYWGETNDDEKFEKINQELDELMHIKLKLVSDEKEDYIAVIQAEGVEVPFSLMSDGNLRMIAYYMLLHESELPPIIAIEEPERNFHPGMLKEIASIIKTLSEQTQVIITTHSSQLLDCFSVEDILKDTSVILINKTKDFKTITNSLNEISKNQEDVLDWMSDFGVGSAIYQSNLLQKILEY